MPTIRTGNQEWDQNLTSLGSALFPDPSKAAHAYYYGAEARKAQIESNKLIDQGNWRSRYGQMSQGGPQPAPPTYIQPDFGAPILAPASNLPMAGAPAAAPSLGAAVTQAADAIPAAIAPMTTGTPPPGTPPTGSNGTPVANDPVSGVLHPGSITTPDGGRKMSGPAAANGSPAPMPPGMTLPGLMAMSAAGSLAGLDAATVAHGGATLAYELYSRGVIGRDQYHQMLGATGSPTLATADTAAAASVTGANIAAASHVKGAQIAAGASTANQAMQTAESKRQFDETPVQTVVDGKPVYTTRAKAIAAGLPYYDSTVANTQQTQGGAAILTQPGGPGTPPISSTTLQAQQDKAPIYEPNVQSTIAAAQNAYKDFIDPANPTRTIRMTEARGAQLGLQPVPTSSDQLSAVVTNAAQNAPTPAAATTITERRDLVAPPPKKTTAEKAQEDADQQFLLDQALQQRLPPTPVSGIFGIGTADDQSTAIKGAASGDLGVVLGRLTNQYLERGPAGIKGQIIAASNAAIQQGIDEGWINLAQPKTKTIIKSVGKDQTPTRHFQIDIVDPKTKQPMPEGTQPNITMKGVPAAAAPAATPAKTPPPGTVLGPANGVPDGRTGTDKETGAKFIVRGGNYVVQ